MSPKPLMEALSACMVMEFVRCSLCCEATYQCRIQTLRQGGGGGHQDPEIRGPFGPQFALKIRGASPRSATKYGFSEEKKTISPSQCSPWPTKVGPTSRTLHSRLPALYSVSIWNQKCHFRKGTNFGNQTLNVKSKMKPKNTRFFNQRREDENQNKYQMLAFTCVEQNCNRRK